MLLTLLTSLSLWFQQPAKYFEETLVIGNGRLGGIIYGGTTTDRIALNDITLWTGEPDLQPTFPYAYRDLPAVRKALAQEDYKKADELNKKIQGHYSQNYQPLGDLYIDYLEPGEEIRSYRRELNLENAQATISYLRGWSAQQTDYFASSPDSVIVIRLQSKSPKGINARIRLTSQLPHQTKSADGRITSDGYAAYMSYPGYHRPEDGKAFYYDPNRGIHYRTIIQPVCQDGEVTCQDSTLVLKGVHEALLLVTNATSFNGPEKDPVKQGRPYQQDADRIIKRAMTKSFDQLQKKHQQDYKALFNRVSLNLGQTDEQIRQLPTDLQLMRYTQNQEKNPELEALYFQFGRYLLISCSRTSGVPANLQGLWNEQLLPPWSSNYTSNINLEENYWAAETTNLPEMHMVLMDFIQNLTRTGAQTARAYYNVKQGWCLAHNTDIWAMTNPVGLQSGGITWANWNMGGAWVSTHIWEHYLFTRDRQFLEQYYPALQGAALFCMNWLVEKDGELITSPSTSPENEYKMPDGYEGASLYGGTADLAMTRECLTDALLAAKELGVDKAFQQKAQKTLARLRPYKKGSRGQLLEWYHDWEDLDWHHRHQSHLFGLYPGHQITPQGTPEVAQWAARSMEIKGDRTTGWSSGWRINLLARLGDAEGAYHMVRTLLRFVTPDKYREPDYSGGGGTYPNLLDAHSPFQIDGNFGGCAGIAEMLLQSTPEGYTLLPALPEQWKAQGEVHGLRTRTGKTISFAWKDGKVTWQKED